MTDTTIAPRGIAGLQALADQFDLFLVDQFGVLHEGVRPYPGAVAALEALAARGKPLIMLSNSGKRAEPNFARVVKLGFPRSALRAVVSSGEVAWQAIHDGTLGAPFLAHARVFVVGKPGDDYGIDGLLSLVQKPEDADFLLICSSNAPATDLAAYADLLGASARAKKPALCSNPDTSMLHETGLQPGAGAIADLYAALGGPVVRIGKPYRAIYDAALAITGIPARTIVIGDSVEHDIRGGADAGLKTALVRTGILADVPEADLETLFARYGARPDYILPAFRWT